MNQEDLVPKIIYLPRPVAEKLEAQARENDRSLSAEGRRIIVKALK